LKARFIKHLVLPLETFSYERKNCVKSLSGMAGIQGHIIRPLGPLGPPADAWLQSNTRYPLGERADADKTLSSWREGGADKTLSIAVGDRDPPETQRPLGPVHTRNETEYAQSL
jgi:hypothetical protein